MSKILLSKGLTNTNKHAISYSAEEACNEILKGESTNFYESYNEKQQIRFFADIDFKRDKDGNSYTKEDMILIDKAINNALQEINISNIGLGKAIVGQSSGKGYVNKSICYISSWRIWWPNSFSNLSTIKAWIIDNFEIIFIQKLKQQLKTNTKIGWINVVDKSVYVGSRKLRCVLSSKDREIRPLILTSLYPGEIEDTFISYIPSTCNEIFYTFNEVKMVEYINYENNISDIESVLTSLSDYRWNTYDTWIKIGMALKNSGYSFELWNKYSKICDTASKYNLESCITHWNSFSSNGELKIGTLYHWLKEDGIDIGFIPSIDDWTEAESIFGTSIAINEPLVESHILFKNEFGLACVFAKYYKNNIVCASHEPNTWYVFNTSKNIWIETYEISIVNMFCENMENIIKSIYDYYNELCEDDEKLKKIQKLINNTTILRVASICVRSASGMLYDKTFSKKLNSKKDILSVLNGTIELRTGMLRPRVREDYFTYILDYNYNPDANLFIWNKYFKTLFCDEEMINYIQWLLGYCLTGEQSAGVLPILYGNGHNGKSALIDFIKKVLGPTLYTTLNKKDFCSSDKNMDSLYYAIHARVATLNEAGKVTLDEEMLKNLTSATDTISVQAKFKSSVEVKFQLKLFIITNDKPTFSISTTSIWDRVRLLPFNVRFEYPESDEWDEELVTSGLMAAKDPLFLEELGKNIEGLLLWMIQGAIRFYSETEKIPKSIKISNKSYKLECNPAIEFLTDNIESSDICKISSLELLNMYKSYLIKNGTRDPKILKDRLLCVNLSSGMKGLGFVKKDYRIEGKVISGYIGCKFKHISDIDIVV